MNKIIPLVSIFILSACASNQSYNYATETQRNPSKVIEIPGYAKDKIFSSSKMWIAENFKSAKSVIEYENKDEGVLIGNGVINYPCEGFECVGKGAWTVPFTMKIEVKDQKIRTSFSNIQLSMPATAGMYAAPSTTIPAVASEDVNKITAKLLKFGDDIKSYIDSGKSNQNW